MNPDSIEYLIPLGKCEFGHENFDQAIHYFIQAYQIDFNPNASYGLAESYNELENVEEASYWANKCLEDGGDD